MEYLMPDPLRTLCRVSDIPENGARGFPGADGALAGVVAIRQGDCVYVYKNACPHIGTHLDWAPDRFLSADGRHLVCATHGAEFTIATGRCISGPCRGDRLTQIHAIIRDGTIHVADID
jgi:nitrite reductase/ring-hydroxylating ferredoxin subunit